MSEQLEIVFEPDPSALPEMVSLREFVEQLEREEGGTEHLKALRAAIEETTP